MIKKEVWTCGVASKHICSNIIEPSLYDQNQKIKWQSEHVMLSLLNPHDVFPHEDNMISSYTCWLWDVFFWRWFTPFYVGMRKFHGYVHSRSCTMDIPHCTAMWHRSKDVVGSSVTFCYWWHLDLYLSSTSSQMHFWFCQLKTVLCREQKCRVQNEGCWTCQCPLQQCVCVCGVSHLHTSVDTCTILYQACTKLVPRYAKLYKCQPCQVQQPRRLGDLALHIL